MSRATHFLAALLLLAAATQASAQQKDSSAAGAQTDSASGVGFQPGTPVARSDVPELVPGTLVQSTLGNFLDPTTPTGLTIRMDGALGPVGDKRTFGFNGFSVTSRMTPGTNELGKRLSLLVGAATWVTPAPATIYPEAYRLTSDTASSGRSVTSAMAGLSVRLLGGRVPTEADWERHNARISTLMVAVDSAGQVGGGARRESADSLEKYLWQDFYRPISRRAVLQVGAVTRLGTSEIKGENTLAAYDAFAVAAAGRGILDFAATVHYLRPLNNDVLAKQAVSGSMAAFADLDDIPPVTTLGLEVAFGRFSYRERTRLAGADPSLAARIEPTTDRLDVTLSFSGLQKTRTAAVGFRYSHLRNSFGEDENQFLVLFSNDFLSALKGSQR